MGSFGQFFLPLRVLCKCYASAMQMLYKFYASTMQSDPEPKKSQIWKKRNWNVEAWELRSRLKDFHLHFYQKLRVTSFTFQLFSPCFWYRMNYTTLESLNKSLFPLDFSENSFLHVILREKWAYVSWKITIFVWRTPVNFKALLWPCQNSKMIFRLKNLSVHTYVRP